jgi:CRP-like cAMP-binding protein
MSQLLRDHIEKVCPLTDEEFDYILSHFKQRKLRKHAFLIQEGEYVNHAYFVVKGCLRAFTGDSNSGKEFIYQFAIEDWWITDKEAFFQGSRSTMNIDCLENCELLAISLSDQQKLGKELWKYEHFLQVKANLASISLQKRLQMMIRGGAKERYEQFIRQYPRLLDRIPKTFIASYLGMSRETLSRLYS